MNFLKSIQTGIAGDIAGADGVALPAHAVECGVFIGDGHGLLIDVAGVGAVRAQQQRRDGQNAAAAAQIQHAHALGDRLFQRLQAQTGGFLKIIIII